MLYPIAIEKGSNTDAYGVIIPDIKGCFSAGNTFEEALENAKEQDAEIQDFVEDPKGNLAEDLAIKDIFHDTIMHVLGTLKPREKEVVILRFGLEDGEPRTLEEIGQMYHLTRERIRQIEAKAIRKLRHPSRSRFLREYDKGRASANYV